MIIKQKFLGAQSLSHNRTVVIVPPTEQELEASCINISLHKGWLVEAHQEVNIEDIINYPLEYLDTGGQKWFRDIFLTQKEVRHFGGFDPLFGPVVISMFTDVINKENKEKVYKVLLRTKDGDDFVFFPVSAVRMSVIRPRPHFKDIIRVIDPRLCESDLNLYELKDREAFTKDLVHIDERQQIKGYKFGVLYCKEGQTTEEEMFGNETGSPAFDRFVATIAEKVPLLNWKQFRAGLDNTCNSTGAYSYYTQVESNEIMLHVSTCLPFKKHDKQQLERKRHIGNDICVIVYREGNNATKYRPNTIESEFNHIIAVVDSQVADINNPDDENDTLALSFCYKQGVPQFGPAIPEGFVFKRNTQFRDVLLRKLINGETAALISPTFKTKIKKTRVATYKNLLDTHKS